MRLISVSPLGDAWTVRVEGVANDMLFYSGGHAEAAARALGERLALGGMPAAIRVFDREGLPVDRLVAGRRRLRRIMEVDPPAP